MDYEGSLAEVFVEVADTLVADFDIVEFLHRLTARCVDVLAVDAAGLMLANPRGRLEVMAASTEAAELMEVIQLQNREGPCLECHRTGRPVGVPDLAAAADRWPRFAPAASAAGFAAVLAVPMRLREQVIGALNLFRARPGELDPTTARVAQALADVATIGLLQQRALHQQEVLIEQLQAALTSRVVIEQAKGVLTQRLGVDMDEAFRVLRGHARQRNHRLTELARAVVEGADDITPPAPNSASR